MESKKANAKSLPGKDQGSVLSHGPMEAGKPGISQGKSIVQKVRKERIYYTLGNYRPYNPEKSLHGSLG